MALLLLLKKWRKWCSGDLLTSAPASSCGGVQSDVGLGTSEEETVGSLGAIIKGKGKGIDQTERKAMNEHSLASPS